MQAQADLTKANAIEFSVRDESWIKYKLEDGTQLFGRLVTPKIFKADEYDPSGQPIYAGPARTSSPPSVRDPSEERPRILLQHPSTRARRTRQLSTLSVSGRRGGMSTSCPMVRC